MASCGAATRLPISVSFANPRRWVALAVAARTDDRAAAKGDAEVESTRAVRSDVRRADIVARIERTAVEPVWTGVVGSEVPELRVAN